MLELCLVYKIVQLCEIHFKNIIFSGRPPDFLAFVITLLMMLLLAAGVKKSLIFNNVLNAINLSAWVFIMAAGLFYVDTDNWTKHDGFLPYGWSGVKLDFLVLTNDAYTLSIGIHWSCNMFLRFYWF